MITNLKILDIENTCTGCGACADVCPKNCLKLGSNNEGFYYPQFDSSQCINCGLCEKVCHVLNSNEKKAISEDNFYTYSSTQTIIREESSSGGAFTLFAEYVLAEGGIVYSTLFNENSGIVEVSNSDLFPLKKFRKSKYVESYVGKSYQAIHKELKSGRAVLFCGTPCQVAGLKRYLNVLKSDTSKLLTIDFICHGVPSAKCFDAFLSRNKRKVIDVDFRYKDFSQKKTGWHDMVYCEYYADGSKRVLTSKNLHYYYYYMPFLENVSLRKSCYFCNEVNMSSADITVGDFWSIHKDKYIVDDNKGVSIVNLHSNKAIELWNKLKENGHYSQVSFSLIANQLTNKNLPSLEKRKFFFDEVNKKGYIPTVRNCYFKKYIVNTIIRYGHTIKSLFIRM